MPIINSIGKYYFSTRVAAIERFISTPVETQQRILFYLLSTAKNTIFGKEYSFSDIKAYEDFKKNIPLQHSE
jgi:YHS domain-containing protein